MNDKVLVSITGFHQTEDGQDTIQTQQPGQYAYFQGKHIIRYEELPEEEPGTEPAAIPCMLRLSPEQVILSKRGELRTEMHFACGKTQEAIYHTPIGALQMAITTTRLTMTETENRIEVQLAYRLSLDGNPVSDCELSIEVKSIEPPVSK